MKKTPQSIRITGLAYLVAFLVLAFSIGAQTTNWDDTLLAYLIDSGDINEEMAELLRTNCRIELLDARKTLENHELHLLVRSSTSKGPLIAASSRKEMRGMVNSLHLLVKQPLLDCLRETSLVRPIAGEEIGPKNTWYDRYLGFLFTHNPSSSRRRELAQVSAEAPATSPEVSSSPPAAFPFFPPTDNSDEEPTVEDQTSDVRSRNEENTKRTIIIAVVVTASVTFVFSSLLFVFCRKCSGSGSGQGRNDESPLLSLSLSEYSIASSRKSYGVGTTVNNEKPGSQSFNKLNHNKNSGNFYMESHAQSNSKIDSPSVNEAVANNLGQHIAPPPPGLPPLKPPPGRADLTKPVTSNPPPSAPIPPTAASMRANVGPTPPPPPPLKSSSSAPRPLPPGPPAPPMQPSSAGSRPPPPPIKPSSGGPSPPPPGPPPPPIPSGGIKAGPRPPGPPPPPGLGAPRPPSLGPKPPRHAPNSSSSTSVNEDETGGPKTKLKPFFWDKVSANPDESMVWNQIKAGSFQFNEEMIESLFGYAAPAKGKNDAKKESQLQDPSIRSVKLIDQKKAQNLAIMLKALNVTTEEVCDAIEEGNELPPELIQTLIKMAPTADEELKLRLFDGELSQLGLAERFLKVLVSIPFAFKRLECLLFMCTLQEEASSLKETFVVLEAACAELRKNRLFLKLLEAVLKTGNRMNDGTFRGGAQAFKLDTLLKLSDVKGTDGKTTLLHFVVQEMIRSEGRRAARAARETRSLSSFKSDDFTEDIPEDSDEQLRNLGLEVVSGVGNELQNVKRAAVIDSESLTGTVSKLGHALVKARDFLNTDMKNVQADKGFHQVLKSFVQSAEVDVTSLLKEEKRIMELVKSTAGYFHGNTGKDEGLRLFVVVRDFLIILEKVCREVKNTPRKPNTTQKKDESVATPLDTKQTAPADPLRAIPADARQRLFPAITDRRMDSSSSDEED